MQKIFRCIKTNKLFPLNKKTIGCPLCDKYYNNLIIEYDYKNIKINKNLSKSWQRYSELMPNKNFEINFDEQETPLIRLKKIQSKYGYKNLFLKDESKNPTGSFKDRGTLVLINCVFEWQINKIFVVSSGNDAISTAAYSQKAGIKCDCLLPKSETNGKKKLMQLFSAKIIEQNKSYEDIFRWVIDNSYKGYNATAGFNSIKEEGVKLLAFELFEEIGVPDLIIVPSGNGVLLFAIYKAYAELLKLGLVKSLPKLIGIQIKHAAPLKLAYKNNQDFIIAKNIPNSIAEGIIATESFASPKVVLALKETKGDIIEVEDSEIIEAMKDLIKLESIIPEPTSASVVAGLRKITGFKEKNVVLVLTSGGIRNLTHIKKFIDG